MLAEIKKAMRISADAYDSELASLCMAGVYDLLTCGVEAAGVHFTIDGDTVTDDSTLSDPLLQRALIIYVRANFGSPEDFDKMQTAYDKIKSKLMMTSGYGIEVGEG